MRNTKYPIFGIILAASTLLWSCSTDKNTRFSRFYQGFTTRYNVYYNGERNYDKAYKSQLQNYKENYTTFFPIHPVSSLKGKTISDYEPAIEKFQKAIKNHSIKIKPAFQGIRKGEKYEDWLKTEEYNPFLHNAWLMMGRSQFYKGDFLASSATFNYISRHFRNLPQAVYESQIWIARCQTELNWLYESDDILQKIKFTDLNKSNQTLWNLAKADLLMKQKMPNEAVGFLEKALSAENNKTQRYRLHYLLGQIHQSLGHDELAYLNYSKVIKMSPPYETEFSARIRQTECIGNNNREENLKKLNSMARKAKNKEYLDQLYYAIGNIYLSKTDTLNATKNYELSILKSEKDINQKTLSQIKLGDIYFRTKQYPEAQPCYSGALAAITNEHPDFDRITKRSEALDELIINYQSVHLQDSLLQLASLTKAQQIVAVSKIIAQIKKREAEEKALAEREKLIAAQAERNGEVEMNNTMRNPSMPLASNDKSWYFYNTASVQKGKADFQSRWGSRRLEDNWRRKNKTSYSFNEPTQKSDEEQKSAISLDQDTLKIEKATDPKKPEFYLQQIPSTNEEKENAHEIVREGLYNMALVYQNRLNDYPQAIATYYDLLRRYPQTDKKADVYFNLFLIGQITEDEEMATEYKNKLKTEFPSSKYSVTLSDPDYVKNYLRKKAEVEKLYENTYFAFLKNDIKTVRQNFDTVRAQYALTKLMPKFIFLNALSFLSERKNSEFKAALNELLEKYPNADVSTLAGAMMGNIAQGKMLSGQSINSNIWSTKVTAVNTTPVDTKLINVPEFTVDPISPHFILFAYPTDSTYNNRLMYEVAGFNFTNFAIRDFDLDMFPLQGIGLLRVKGFASFDETVIYRKRLFGEKGIANRLPAQLKTVLISEKNFETLLKGRTFEEYFTFFEKNFSKK